MATTPTSFTYSQSPAGTINLAWSYPATSPAGTTFEIQYRDVPSGVWEALSTISFSVGTSQYSYSDAIGLNQVRYYRIRAVDTSAGGYTNQLAASSAVSLDVVSKFEVFDEPESGDYVLFRDLTGEQPLYPDGYETSLYPVSNYSATLAFFNASGEEQTQAPIVANVNPAYQAAYNWSEFSNGKPVDGVYRAEYTVVDGTSNAQMGVSSNLVIIDQEFRRSLLDAAGSIVKLGLAGCCDSDPEESLESVYALWRSVNQAMKLGKHDKASEYFSAAQRMLACIC